MHSRLHREEGSPDLLTAQTAGRPAVEPAGGTRLTDGFRLAAAAEETQRLERALAAARAGIGALLLAVEIVESASWRKDAWLPVALLAVFTAQALALWFYLRRHDSTVGLRRLIHGSDLVWAAVLSAAGGEVLIVIGVLAIYAAASRWTRIQAIATAAAIGGLLIVGQLLLTAVGPAGAHFDFDPRASFLNVATLLVLSFLFGHVTRREKELRAETTRAKAMDRAIVARELHDGAIQSLIGLEVQVDVLRRKTASRDDEMAAELERVEGILHAEVLNLRELMQQIRPPDLDPRHLPDFLAEAVDRFRRDTGIAASFVSDLREVEFSSRICRELARIAQEALVNVRKHSGAANVVVRLAVQGGKGRLVVDDDGRGFDFSGRLSQEELDLARKGPVIIKERVRAIGGSLSIESSPGRGARLEIAFPYE